MILQKIRRGISSILRQVKESELERYDYIQTSLAISDVTSNLTFQRTFNGYYRMLARPADWYTYFFGLLEARKRDANTRFQEVLTTIHRDTGRVEPSFSSKLVATIRADSPVYDRYVRENLRLEIPRQTDPIQIRVRDFIRAHAQLCERVNELVDAPVFADIREQFDRAFPHYTHFTDIKKLDLLLWKMR